MRTALTLSEYKNKFQKIIYLLDHDGTMHSDPIDHAQGHNHDEGANDTAEIFYSLVQAQNSDAYIISGRGNPYLEKFYGEDYRSKMIGTHGAEYLTTEQQAEELQIYLDTFFRAFLELMAQYPGSYLPKSNKMGDPVYTVRKKLSIAMMMQTICIDTPELYEEIVAKIHQIIPDNKLEGRLEILSGKGVQDLIPKGANKGNATTKLLEELKPGQDTLVIAAGNDNSDLGTFGALDQADVNYLAVVVGNRVSFEATNAKGAVVNIAEPKDLRAALKL